MSKALIILKVLGGSFLTFILTLLLQLVSILVLPIVLLFVKKESETLPNAFAWFDNAEIRIGKGKKDDGLAGYPGYREEMIPKYGLYLTRYIWLAFRNPVNYFQYSVLGVELTAPITVDYDDEYYDSTVGNKSGNTEGLSIRSVNGTVDAYYVKKITSTRCLRIRVGHKLPSNIVYDLASRGDAIVAQFVFTINLAEYEGV